MGTRGRERRRGLRAPHSSPQTSTPVPSLSIFPVPLFLLKRSIVLWGAAELTQESDSYQPASHGQEPSHRQEHTQADFLCCLPTCCLPRPNLCVCVLSRFCCV